MAMRPPIPSLILSRRAKIALLVVAILIVLFILANSFVGVYINWLWFGSVGFREVYTHRLLDAGRAVLHLRHHHGGRHRRQRRRSPTPPVRRFGRCRPSSRTSSATGSSSSRASGCCWASCSSSSASPPGMAAQGDWQIWQLFLNGGQFGVKDPQFHRDISFFAWDYPAYRTMLSFGFALVIFSLILSVAVYYIFGAIRIQTPGPKITLSARRHLTVLIFLFIVLKAIAYWLDRYGLVYSNRGQHDRCVLRRRQRRPAGEDDPVLDRDHHRDPGDRQPLAQERAAARHRLHRAAHPEHRDQRHLPGDRAADHGQAERQPEGSARTSAATSRRRERRTAFSATDAPAAPVDYENYNVTSIAVDSRRW